jgi:hypothetical protein
LILIWYSNFERRAGPALRTKPSLRYQAPMIGLMTFSMPSTVISPV